MKNIYLYEPSIASNNTGDAIIVEGVKTALKELLDQHYVIEMPTHTPLSNRYALFLGNPDLKFVCGSNIITGSLDQLIHIMYRRLDSVKHFVNLDSITISYSSQKKIQFYRKNTLPDIDYVLYLAKAFVFCDPSIAIQCLTKISLDSMIS